MAAVTKEQLSNASVDAETIAEVVNGLDVPGTLVSRLGRPLQTFAKLQADFLDDKSLLLTAAETALDEAVAAVADAVNQVVIGGAPIPSVENVSLIPLLNPASLTNGQMLFAKGYYLSGDGGGQFLKYYSTGRGSVTIDNGFYFAGPGTVDYFESIQQQIFNVRCFGAKGDGVADDLTKIVAAVNAAIAKGGGTVYLPRGTYLLSGDVYLASNITFIGEQGQTFIEPFNSTWVPVIYATGSNINILENINIANLTFKKTNSSWRNAAGQVFVSHTKNVRIENIHRRGTSLDTGQSVVSVRRTNNFFIENISSVNTFVDSSSIVFSGTWGNGDNAALLIDNISIQHICTGTQTPAQVAAAVCALAAASTHPNFTQYNWSVTGATITVSAVVPGTPINIAQSVGANNGAVTGTQNFQGCIYQLQNWNGLINRVHSEWSAEGIDFTGCYNVHCTNVTGSNFNQEVIDFGNSSNIVVSNVTAIRCRRVIQMKTEATSSPPPGYVAPGGCNNNLFSNIRATYFDVGIKNTSNLNPAVEIQTMDNNKYVNIDVQSTGATSLYGFVVTPDNDNSPGENFTLSNFRIKDDNGIGVYISQDVANFNIVNGTIVSKGRAINHDYPASIVLRDRCTISNVEIDVTDNAAIYAIWLGPRRNTTLRDLKIIGGGIYMIDQIDLTMHNVSIEECPQRGLLLEWRGQDTTTWPLIDGRVNAILRDIRLKNLNKVSQTVGVGLVQSGAVVTVVRDVIIDRMSITDTQVSRTTCGMLPSGTFEDCMLLNSFVPVVGGSFALVDPRAAQLSGVTNINRGNRGYMLSENRGQVSVSTGTTFTNFTTNITGIAAEDIQLVPLNAAAAAAQAHVTYVNTTVCRIVVASAPASTATWAWTAERIN